MQYLLAGARASVGLKSGRYMFEAKVIELLHQIEVGGAATRNVTKNILRLGVSTAGCLPLLGDTEESVCFDSDGYFQYNNKKEYVCEPFDADCLYAVVVNLSGDGKPNSNTISLFRDGRRACEPQPLPDGLQGRILYPT